MKTRIGIVLSAALALSLAHAGSGAALQAPDKVRDALRMLAYVQADMASKLPNRAYERLPHENQEFQEAAPALSDAIAGEPAAFRSQAAALLRKAQAAAQDVAAASHSGDAVQIAAAVAAVAAALKPLNELFPAELRPVARQPGRPPGMPGRGGPTDPGRGPPAELR